MSIKAHKPAPISFLIADISRQIRRRFDVRLSTYGLTQAQWRAILAISSNPGATQRTIAELLEIQPISLTRLMDRMERGGWVKRCPDPEDRRAVKLYLTPQAQPVLSVAAECSAELLEAACRGLDQSQQDQLLALLGTVKKNLSDA